MLSERADVWVPPFKELHFFDHKFKADTRAWTGWHVKKGVETARRRYLISNSKPDPDYLDYLDTILKTPMFNGTWYKNIFSQAPINSVCLDVTPAYSCISKEGVSFVASFLKDAKFIYIIRSPLDRALSQLRMDLSRNGIPLTKDEWIKRATAPVILSRGDYKLNIPRWREHFDESRLLFLPFQQIAQKPYIFLKQVEQFVGLPPFDNYKKATKKIHRSSVTTLPDYIIEIVKENVFEQDEFLNEYFGHDFLMQ